MNPHLPDVRRELLAAASRQRNGRSRYLTRRTAAFAAIAGFGVVAVGAAGAVVISDHRPVDPTIVKHLSVLRRDRVASDDAGAVGAATDALYQRAQAAGAENDIPPDPILGLDFTQTRRVRTSEAAVNIWMAPDHKYGAACLVQQLDGAQIGQVGPCLFADHVDTGSGPQTVTWGAHTDIFGIVPDGVATATVTLRDGSTRMINVQDNVYAARLDRPTKCVEYHTPSGYVHYFAPSG